MQRDGLQAVTKMNDAEKNFDLILMDIIMPNLDGVSATVCIREIRPNIPIIAMTSNIRADDIDMYFRYGESVVIASNQSLTGIRYERCLAEALYKRRHATVPRKASVAI